MAGAPESQPGDAHPEVDFTDVLLNVGGWLFSVPRMVLAQFRESVLWKEACAFTQSSGTKIFIDRDGLVFRNIHHFFLTSQLLVSSLSDLGLLYEQARGLHLQPVIEALDKLQTGEPQLCDQTADKPVAERASIYSWKTHKCSSRLSEFPIKRSLLPGLHDKAPLGLLESPLIDTEEEVHYCFFPIHLLENYPSLVTDDCLLWFSESFILIESGCDQFRFIGNFLLTGKFLLPENFSKFEDLKAEIKSLGIPGVLQALRREQKSLGNHGYRNTGKPVTTSSSKCVTGDKLESYKGEKPLYMMALELLAKYPDSALGQLSVESSVNGSKLYITGTGTLFQHVKNWLGTCRLPLTCSLLEIYDLCMYLDKGDIIYQPVREAVRSYLKHRASGGLGGLCNNWTADVQELHTQQIVRVYVGTHWYATHLRTLLKYPELLDNPRKACWISCGFALLVNGDGQMFRHILNFLRLGSFLLPSAFTEWRLLCQEVNEFNIPSLVEALQECQAYRLWLEKRVPTGCSEDPKPELPETSTESSACDQHQRRHVSSPGPSGEDALNLPHSPVHKGAMQQAIPVYRDPMQCLNSAHKEEKLVGTTCNGARNDEGRVVPKDYGRVAMEMEGPDDLGAFLWVHHHHLVANDGSAAAIQESVLYTTDCNIPEPADYTAAPNDIVFLRFNMTHEEIFYARNCHSFLTGVILDSIQQGDPKSSTCSVMMLVSMLWDSQLPTRQFVDDLLTLGSYRDEKSTREQLLRWLELTLPCARKFSRCVNVMLQKGAHRAASCSAVTAFLAPGPVAANCSGLFLNP